VTHSQESCTELAHIHIKDRATYLYKPLFTLG